MRDRFDDRGATLILALVFLVVGALTAVSITQLSTENLLTTNNTRIPRAIDYSADAAIDGAIQQNRYHSGACESFPKTSAPLQLGGVNVYVSCSSTTIGILVAEESSSCSLTVPPGGGSFPSPGSNSPYAITSQPITVTNSSGTTVVGTVSAVTSSTTATMSPIAPHTCASAAGTVSVGSEAERYDTFSACASSSTVLSSCTSAQIPEITASLLFQDFANTLTSCPPSLADSFETGCTSTIESWVVTDANA